MKTPRFLNTLNLEAGIVIHDNSTNILAMNDNAKKLLGESYNIHANDPKWHFIDKHGAPLLFENYPVNKIISTKTKLAPEIIGVYSEDVKHITWITVSGFPVFDENDNIKRVVISFIDHNVKFKPLFHYMINYIIAISIMIALSTYIIVHNINSVKNEVKDNTTRIEDNRRIFLKFQADSIYDEVKASNKELDTLLKR